MEFLYYRPVGSKEPHDGRIFDAPPHLREVSKGPDGGRGTLAATIRTIEAGTARCVYDAAGQTWRRIPGSEWWVGFWCDAKPGPDDLSRSTLLDSQPVVINGQAWQVPICRVFADGQATIHLPQAMDLDDTGNWVIGPVVEQYRKLWDASKSYFDFILSQIPDEDGNAEPIEIMVADVADACVVVLGTNYRVNAIEVAMLGLLDSHTRAQIMQATVDVRALTDRGKKKRIIEPSALTRGEPDVYRPTVPA